MHVVSNAFFDQVEVVQTDRWSHGPLELLFVDVPERVVHDLWIALAEWNRHGESGFVRSAETLQAVSRLVPGIEAFENPNLVLVPRISGFTELHTMLASILPTETLFRFRLKRERANFWLWPMDIRRKASTADRTRRAFETFIWSRITKGTRSRKGLRPSSSLHLLAGDTPFWMNRLYRVAIERRQQFGEVASDPGWEPMEELAARFRREIPDHEKFVLRRPLMGGWLWDPESSSEREEVVREALSGSGVMESMTPVIDLLHSHRTHEDFSDRYSWVKEDFERSFYSKRSKVKVSFVETLDDFPAWSGTQTVGYENVLLRELLAFCNVRERRIILALRQGKSGSQIAREQGLRGHATISRQISRLKRKIRALLQ